MRPVLALPLILTAIHVYADEAAIRRVLAERHPDISVAAVTPAPIPGLFEVWANGRMLYTDAKADYILGGPLVETATRVNLSKKRIEELRVVKFDTLPLDKAIPVVKGTGERKLAVFSDPDCPFCRKLEKELALLDNVTIYTFLYPIEQLHPKAPEISRRIWCAEDRAASWLGYMLDGKQPEAADTCENPVQEIAALGTRLGIDGTPALVFTNGKRVDGHVPAAKLDELLNGK